MNTNILIYHIDLIMLLLIIWNGISRKLMTNNCNMINYFFRETDEVGRESRSKDKEGLRLLYRQLFELCIYLYKWELILFRYFVLVNN